MKHYRSKPFCPPPLHYTVSDLMEAAESGNVTEVKRLLKNSNFPEGVKNAASQTLGLLEPLNHPFLDDYWTNWRPDSDPTTPDEQKSMCSAYQDISQCIHLLLDAGADPNAVDRDGVTVLNRFDTQELTSVFNRLLRIGANPNFNYYGGNLLCNAVSSDNELRVQLLLDYGADPNIEDHKGDIPFIEASFESRLKILQQLIATGADINHKNNNGETPLMVASRNQALSVMQTFIHAGADVNCSDNIGRTALMHALIEHGDVPILVLRDWVRECHSRSFPKERCFNVTSLLIASGAELDKADSNGFFPSDYALMAHLNGVELPFELEPNPVYLRFCRAAINNSFNELELLSEPGWIPSRIMSLALHLAATRGYVMSCMILLKHGADVNGLDLWGNHPIESAAVGLNSKVVELMTEYAVTVEGLNRALLSTCMARSRYWPDEDTKSYLKRRFELARHLLQHGANPNHRDDDSDPPLRQAVADIEDCELVLLLLEYGADPTETGEDGETLLDFARTDRMKAILRKGITESCRQT